MRWLTRSLVSQGPEQASRRLIAAIPAADKTALYAAGNLEVFVQSIREGYRTGWQGVAQDDIIVNRDWAFDLADVRVPVDVWHGEADVNVPLSAGQGARLFFAGGGTLFRA